MFDRDVLKKEVKSLGKSLTTGLAGGFIVATVDKTNSIPFTVSVAGLFLVLLLVYPAVAAYEPDDGGGAETRPDSGDRDAPTDAAD